MVLSSWHTDYVEYFFHFDVDFLLGEINNDLNYEEIFTLLNEARRTLYQAKMEIDSAIGEIEKLRQKYEEETLHPYKTQMSK